MGMFGFNQHKKITPDNGSTAGQNDDNTNNNGADDQNDEDESLFGDFVNPDDADSEFNLGEDFFKQEGDDDDSQGDGTQLSEEQKTIMKEVSDAMKADIGRAILEDKDFMDFDVNDQTKIRSMLDKTMQRGAAAAVTAMMHPLKRSIDDAMSTLRKEFQAGFQQNNVKSKAEQAFEPIGKSLLAGVQDKNLVAFAKTNFQTVLQRTKNVQKAQEATVALLKTMGFLVSRDGKPARKMNQFGGGDNSFDFDSGGNSGGNRGVKTGSEALDSFFPSK